MMRVSTRFAQPAGQWFRRVLTAAMALAPCATVSPQDAPPVRQQDSLGSKLELAPDPAIDRGKVAVVQGMVGAEGVRYTLGSLSILQPVDVMLLSRDASDDLTLSLFKREWETPDRSGSTRGSGIAQFVFRTQGGFNILVRGQSEPKPYALVVWAGDEARPRMGDVVMTYDEFRKRNPAAAKRSSVGGGGSRSVPVAALIGSAALVGAAALISLHVVRRRKQA